MFSENSRLRVRVSHRNETDAKEITQSVYVVQSSNLCRQLYVHHSRYIKFRRNERLNNCNRQQHLHGNRASASSMAVTASIAHLQVAAGQGHILER